MKSAPIPSTFAQPVFFRLFLHLCFRFNRPGWVIFFLFEHRVAKQEFSRRAELPRELRVAWQQQLQQYRNTDGTAPLAVMGMYLACLEVRGALHRLSKVYGKRECRSFGRRQSWAGLAFDNTAVSRDASTPTLGQQQQ